MGSKKPEVKSIDDCFKFMGWKDVATASGGTERMTYYKCKLCKIHVGRDYRESHYVTAHTREPHYDLK